jgi:large subunit ribosomal protein L25
MIYALTAEKRSDLGRRAKRLFASGKIPAVIYGRGTEPQAIQVVRNDFRKLYRAAGSSSLIDLTVAGGSAVKALIQEVQVNIISLEPAHVDFRQIDMKEELTVDVPLRFTGDCKAVKELGGTLVTPFDTIQVKCLPANLPHDLEVDITSLAAFDDELTVASIKVPPGVEILEDAASVIANISRPLTEDELKKLEETAAPTDVTAIKTEAEEKKAAEEIKKAEEETAETAK